MAGQVKIEVYAPKECLSALRSAMSEAGAGRVGRYDLCCSWWEVAGSWRPLEGARPYNGEVGKLSEAVEIKLEMRCDETLARAAVAAVRKVHPYEEPVINVLPLLDYSS